jgi:hypothetical protein
MRNKSLFEIDAKSKDNGVDSVGNHIRSAAYRIFPICCLRTPVRPVTYRVRPAGCNTSSTPIRPTAYRVRPVACR